MFHWSPERNCIALSGGSNNLLSTVRQSISEPGLLNASLPILAINWPRAPLSIFRSPVLSVSIASIQPFSWLIDLLVPICPMWQYHSDFQILNKIDARGSSNTSYWSSLYDSCDVHLKTVLKKNTWCYSAATADTWSCAWIQSRLIGYTKLWRVV